MTIAAKQFREYLQATYPGVRISRLSCRLTASGKISQHSAYGYPEPYDSNAVDVFAPAILTREAQQAWLDSLVADVDPFHDQWSVRQVLWRVPDHFGHAHVDFWPTMISPRKWCADRNVTPVWEYSFGTTVAGTNPEPENGRYQGGDMFAQFVAGWVAGLAEDKAKAEKEFRRLYRDGILEGSSENATVGYWVGLLDDPLNPEWLGFYARTELSVWGR